MAKRILIVDDSATARMMIRRCLEIAGMVDAEYHEAGNGVEAIEVLDANPVDLIFTDLNMPEMDGEELLTLIRARESTALLPVVIVSSAGNEAKDMALRKAGASMILSKPISPAIFADILPKLEGD